MLGGVDGFLKLLFDAQTLQLLGVHAFGEGATEIIHIGQASGARQSISFWDTRQRRLIIFNFSHDVRCVVPWFAMITSGASCICVLA